MQIRRYRTYRFTWILLTLLLLAFVSAAEAQNNDSRASRRRRHMQVNDSILLATPDSIDVANRQQLMQLESPVVIDVKNADSIQLPKQWIPNPTKATWMALVFPGGGQIYNKKYWKLPIFYAGFAGCAYALTWNNRMYKDYSSAYKDAVNNNWTAKSITELIPKRYLERTSSTQVTELLRKRKDTYRRYRDISVFAFIAVYALSVIDAYVDAELSNFDISPDLSMRVKPAVIDNQWSSRGGLKNQAVGLECSLEF
ncbi:MAG: hypothetical protein K6F78_04495 [Bacteroidaceae bacterium]|nr:hypothetical protein [Bacteroidaceae bacterium]